MRLPQAKTGDSLDAAVIGLPSDSGAPFRTGARFGPQAIRAMSVMLRPINPYRSNVNVFEQLRIADAGDANVTPGYLETSMDQITEAVGALVQDGVVPVSLGGDHSVSLPALRAVAGQSGPLALLHFDAHSDTWPSYFSDKAYSAGTPFRRAVEENLIDPFHSVQIGLRGSLFREDDISQSVDLGFDVISTETCLADGPAAVVERAMQRIGGRPVYVTFDMDFVDPASAPGVETPEAGGPNAFQALSLLRAFPAFDLRGCDIVETSPLYDGPGQVTALLAATVSLELLSLLAQWRCDIKALGSETDR